MKRLQKALAMLVSAVVVVDVTVGHLRARIRKRQIDRGRAEPKLSRRTDEGEVTGGQYLAPIDVRPVGLLLPVFAQHGNLRAVSPKTSKIEN